MDELECAFGGRSQASFNITDYAARMREDDNKMPLFWSPENSALASEPYLMKNHGSQQCSSGLKTEETALDKIEEKTENVSEKSEEVDSTSEETEETEDASEERGQTEILSEKRRETEADSVKDETETRSEKKEETESSTVKLTTSSGEGITSSDKGGSSSDP